MVWQSGRAILTTIGKDDSLRSSYKVNVHDYQALKEIEDQVSDMILCLDSTLDTVSTLTDMYCRYYSQISKGHGCERYSGGDMYENDEVLIQLQEKLKDVSYSRKKAEALLTKAQNTRALVGLQAASNK
jgi:hypothetical protein